MWYLVHYGVGQWKNGKINQQKGIRISKNTKYNRFLFHITRYSGSKKNNRQMHSINKKIKNVGYKAIVKKKKSSRNKWKQSQEDDTKKARYSASTNSTLGRLLFGEL